MPQITTKYIQETLIPTKAPSWPSLDLACRNQSANQVGGDYFDFIEGHNGFKHLMVNYLGTIPESIELYSPYQNRECLHCHGIARSFKEGEMHVDFLEELRSGETSCLECHSLAHDVVQLDSLDLWNDGAGP